MKGRFVFSLVFIFSFWLSQDGCKPKKRVALQSPLGKECVESKEYMKKSHANLLYQWRDMSVRQGKKIYINSQGKMYHASLQRSCFFCHSPEKFCSACHVYIGAKEPNCWTCHVFSHEKK